MKLTLSCTSQELLCLTRSVEYLSSACLYKDYSDQERAQIFSAFVDCYRNLISVFKQYLNHHGFVVCSPKSVFQNALNVGLVSEAECHSLCNAAEILNVLSGSYDEENVLLPELLIESEYAPVLIHLAKKYIL